MKPPPTVILETGQWSHTALQGFEPLLVIVRHDGTVGEDRPRAQEAEALVEIGFASRRQAWEKLPGSVDFLLGLVEVGLHSQVGILHHVAEAI